jgi:hypothetical protein
VNLTHKRVYNSTPSLLDSSVWNVLKKQQFHAPAVQPKVQICHAKNRSAFVIFMAFYCYFSFISYTFMRLCTEIGCLLRVRAAALKFRFDHWFTKQVILGDARLKSRDRCHLFQRYFNLRFSLFPPRKLQTIIKMLNASMPKLKESFNKSKLIN